MAASIAQIETLVDEALELPPKDRRAHLARYIDDRDTLSAAEGRLTLMESAMSFLVTAGWAPDDAGSLAAGERIGAWAIDTLLGSGGMGEVYRVRRADGYYEQTAAIKLTRIDSEEAEQRFETERRILARLEHSNIARLIDGGVAEDGRHFMVVELIDGDPIDHYAKERNLGLRARVALMIPVCKAVSHAHSRLVLHRDLKPANILVNEYGEIKVIDFGIAESLAEAKGGSVAATPMTRAFAAPEQVEDAPVSAASDIFALGATLCLLLTGQTPVRSQEGQVSLPERISLPKDLEAILIRCLAEDPAVRYASADALAGDLQNFLDHAPVDARQGGAGYRILKFAGRYRWATGLAAALLLSLAAGLTASSVLAVRANAEADRANQLLADTKRLYAESEHAGRMEAAQSQALLSVFNAGSGEGGGIEAGFVRERLIAYANENMSYIGDYPNDVAYSLVAIGSIFLRRNDYTALLEILEPYKDWELARPRLETTRDALLARAYMGMNRNAEAVPLLRRAIEADLARDADHYASPEHASSVSSLAVASGETADSEAAIAVLRDAIERDEELTGCFWCSFFYNELGVHQRALGDFEAAAAALERSVSVLMEVDPTRRANTDRALMNLADIRYHALGDRAQAQEALDEVLAIAEGIKGESQVLGEAHALLAEMALTNGDAEAALTHIEEAQRLFAEFGGDINSTRFALRLKRIRALCLLDRAADAQAEIARLEAAADNATVERQVPLARAYLAAAKGETERAQVFRGQYAEAVGQLDASIYWGPYRLDVLDRHLSGG